jgi:predicted transcriptional regulator
MASLGSVDISLDQLLQSLASGSDSVSQAQLVSAMRKFLPLMEQADQQLKLGLAKVVLHLKKRLNG